MLKNFLKMSFVMGLAAASLSQVHAQTVSLQIVGSSAYFLEAGLGAHLSTGPINASCLWSASSGVSATDTTVTPNAVDSGSAWVAWTPGTGGTCASPASTSVIYAYLNTDSVVGNRCLFNGCTLTYPTTDPASAGLILGTSSEVALPETVAAKLNAQVANVAGSDIRPEDAEFAIARALATPCGATIGSTQYLGLGYSNGGVINSAISTKKFNVVKFTLPSTAPNVTVVGATAILVAIHSSDDANGFATSGNLTSAQLAHYLDGTTNTTPAGEAANVLVREPLSGTYNTMEYNVPNTTVNQTSQDVGKNQLAAQQNCILSGGVEVANPTLKFTASNGAERLRAIGTGEELAEVGSFANGNTTDNNNNLGYGFWSVANYAGLGALANTGYYTIDSIDPLNSTSCSYNGVIPTTGSSELACVDMHNVANGSYPIYSLLRMINTNTAISTTVSNLAKAAQDFVSFGTTTSRPDFIVPSSMTSIREHFTPPLGLSGSTYPTTNVDGDKQFTTLTNCTALPEAGGDVGGVVVPLRTGTGNNSTFCSTNHVTNGQVNGRR
ncbi:hypothetical protein HNQ77_003661 [Silvibacterium bohemicum]|uniref:PBP domain-containing protein n=1 Tax=Silvibacterium bohemicum TaxID=1577686 RepID=A0A841JX16_9BACT|nr:hypothetical protein [Silvibacterium bohemicum]MBB6145700.1 hypothetical protein [Silvibacterium bohemicum]